MTLRIVTILSIVILLTACGSGMMGNDNAGNGGGSGNGTGQGGNGGGSGNGMGQGGNGGGSGNGMGQGNGGSGNGGMGQGNGMMGRDNGMMARHHATIPTEYTDMSNTVSADEASLSRGGEVYTAQCATCHGDGGMGDGPAASALEPAPAAIAHTGQMLSDSYLFWRISEGGAMEPFNSGMPSYKAGLDEETRWDVINYIQALGAGTVKPNKGMGGQAYDPEIRATRQAEMLDEAVKQGIISQEEADIFGPVHTMMENLRMSGDVEPTGDMNSMQATMLEMLIERGDITEEEAATFMDVHDRLGQTDLMP